MKRFGYLLLFLSLGLSAGCSSSSTTSTTGDGTVTVSTLTIGGVALSSSTTTALTSIPTSFDITFSGDVELADVQDGLTITCEEAVDLTITESSTANTFTVTMSGRPIPQNATCTLSLAATISPAALTKYAKALFTATDYEFTTPCVTGTRFDEFNDLPGTGDDGCWDEATETNWTLSLSDPVGQLIMTIPAADSFTLGTAPVFYNTTTAENIEIEAKIDAITGWDTVNRSSLSLAIVDGFDNRMQPGFAICAVELVAGPVIEAYLNLGNAESTSTIANTDVFLTATDGEALYLKLGKVGDTVTCSYRVGDTGDFTNVAAPADLVFSDATLDVGVIGEKQGATAEDVVYTIDWISVTES